MVYSGSWTILVSSILQIAFLVSFHRFSKKNVFIMFFFLHLTICNIYVLNSVLSFGDLTRKTNSKLVVTVSVNARV